MAFIWTNDPNIPVFIPPPVLGPTEVSTEVHVVANTVNVSPLLCTLSYNTHNIGYDVVCAYPRLNVHDLHVTHLNADNLTVNFNATINTANIGAATINTANIVNATIANGQMGINPTANLQIATKEYVDALIANSVPLGGNLQLLIQAAGDLLVGVSDNTAERLPVGTTEKQVLAVGGSGNTGLHWVGPQGSSSSHRGLEIGTHWETALKNTQIQLVTVDEIVMDDGERIASGWNGLIADLSSNVATSGPGYLDTGVRLPNTCYEVYAIRSSTSGDQALLLHQALDRKPDVHLPCPATGSRNLYYSYGLNQSVSINVAQKFIANKSGPFVGIDLTLGRTGTPVGNVWVTLEDNDATDNASGVVLATSRKFSAGRMGAQISDQVRVRFPFDTSANVVMGNTYWAVAHADYTQGNSQTNLNHLKVFGDSGLAYALGAAKFFNANTNGWAMVNSAATIDGISGPSNFYIRTFIEANSTPVAMPAGYDQRCLLSYCSTNIRTTLREYHQREYKMAMPFHYTWCYRGSGGLFSSPADNPGANNSPVVAYSEVIHMGEMVPPVPCIVWIGKYTGLAGAATLGVGNLSATNLPVQLPVEENGSLSTTIAQNQIGFVGPIFVEFNAHINHSGGSTFGALHIAEIEF
jgi:hypothetical protein